MARSIDPRQSQSGALSRRRTDEERFLMRHIEDLARTAQSRGIARYSGFLSDREQQLARAALAAPGWKKASVLTAAGRRRNAGSSAWNRSTATRKTPSAVCSCSAVHRPVLLLPVHKDYLGSLMGLEIRREALGDIVLPPDAPGTAYVFALEPRSPDLSGTAAGRPHRAGTQLLAPDEVPEFRTAERRIQTATVSSLRLDAVLAAMLRCSRGQASELITAGRVEINHLPAEKPSARCTRVMCLQCAARGALL